MRRIIYKIEGKRDRVDLKNFMVKLLHLLPFVIKSIETEVNV